MDPGSKKATYVPDRHSPALLALLLEQCPSYEKHRATLPEREHEQHLANSSSLAIDFAMHLADLLELRDEATANERVRTVWAAWAAHPDPVIEGFLGDKVVREVFWLALHGRRRYALDRVRSLCPPSWGERADRLLDDFFRWDEGGY